MESAFGAVLFDQAWLRDGFLEEIFQIHGETGASFYGDIVWNLLIMELWHKKAGAGLRAQDVTRKNKEGGY